ncbi:hypothetical protein J6590_013102 [Homalodisca vitripennis]|nr:hypothetical protein J6590_013102 [Homalodisca vitripennis]
MRQHHKNILPITTSATSNLCLEDERYNTDLLRSIPLTFGYELRTEKVNKHVDIALTPVWHTPFPDADGIP